MGKYYNMTSGVLTVTTRDRKTAVVAGKSYLVLAAEEDRSSEVLRLVRKGLLKLMAVDPANVATVPAPAPVKAAAPKTKPAPKKAVKAAAPEPKPEIIPEPEPAPEPEPVEEDSMDPVEAILGTSPEVTPSEETPEIPQDSETAPRRTKRRRKRSQ